MSKKDRDESGKGPIRGFGDLKRLFGGDEGLDSEKEDAGSPTGGEESGEEPDSGEEPVSLTGEDRGVRELIDARPEGFGPMATGPACYADPDSEEMRILQTFRVRTIFPEDVLAEVRRLPADPPQEDYEGLAYRLDLRDRRIFTIDGDDAKDFDDAISIRALEGGGHEMSVHIADVSHYVRPGTALDAEAITRATSVYVADQVVPMLPEELSNHLCSLVPHRPRLAFSVFMEFDAEGRRKSFWVTKSVIRSMHRCTYEQVQALLDGKDDEKTRRIADIRPDLEMFAQWTRTQQKLRDRKGSLRMQSSEIKYRFDSAGEVTGLYPSPTYFSQTLIEETALAANQAVGDFFRLAGLPTIYRIHPEKDQEEQDKVVEMLEKYGVRVPKKERLTGRDIGQMIRFVRTLPNANAMVARVMGLLERAAYEVQDENDAAPHFGLAREHYLHFTSPIRRYPDLIVHRMLFETLVDRDQATRKMKDGEWIQELIVTATHATAQAEVAEMVETAIDDLKLCQYMEPRIGRDFMATVGRVSKFGFDVDLVDECIRGYLPSKTIGSHAVQEGPVLRIKTQKGTKVFREGDRVRVKVEQVDFVRLKVLFALA